MNESRPLHLYEELLLLALRNRQGTPATPFTGYALAGAILSELLLAGRISAGNGNRVTVNNDQALGDPLLDACLLKIRTGSTASLKRWVSRLAAMRTLRDQAARQLCRRGILQADSARFLLVFKRTIYREVDPGPERAIIARMHQAIFSGNSDVDPRTAVLIALADGADLLGKLFGRAQLQPQRARIERIASGEMTGQATREVIQACKAAVLIAATLPAVTSAAIN